MALPPRGRQKQIIAAAANKYGIRPAVLWGLYGAESNFGRNTNVSSAGAQGPFQFMPSTAAGMGVDPHNFRSAAFGAAKYLATYKDRGTRGMLAAYNAGPAGNPNNPETAAYVPKVLQLADSWNGPSGATSGGGGAGGGATSGGGPLATVTGGANPGFTVGQGSQGIVALLQSLQSQKQAPPSAGLEAPAFSAAPVTPAGYKAPVSGGGPAPKTDLTAAISALQGTGQTISHPGSEGATATIPGTPTVSGGGGGGGGSFPATGDLGKVTVASGADRPGVRTSPAVVNFGRRVAGLLGSPITLGTGTNHSRLTVNGNVSQHWSGNAGDFPMFGRRLIRAGQAALIAAGMSPRKARQQTGGLYNVGGAQIIFNTQAGGDHTDHLHIGVNRR